MLNPGDRFGDYAVVRLLGKGGMGSVFLLANAAGGQVAAKILDPETAGDHEARKRFLREAELALGVKHPNLVETYDVGEDPETGLCYILMEYVSGGSLAGYLKENGALPVEDAVAVVQAMAQVLELAREKGIVHRDIKPANIMFDAEGTPKLADLGIARGGLGGTDTTTVTQTGMVIGTPAYMAPEQMLDAHHVDTRADIYSLGVVFFEMLTGERPNKDDTVVQLMAKAVKGEPIPDVRAMRPEVSASLAQLLAMMVVPDKNGRISTPGQISNALDIIERGGTFAAKPAAPAKKRKRRKAFPWKAVIPAGILGVLAAAFAVLAPTREQKNPQQVAKPAVQTVVRTVVQTNVVEKVVEKPVAGKEQAKEKKTSGREAVAPQPWQPGPSAAWFVNWDEALADARERQRPILVLSTGSTWCHWCKKLRAEVLDSEVFKSFAADHLTLLYLDSPCANVDQRNHNKRVVKALKFGGGVPNVRVFASTGALLGSVGGGGLAADAYVGKLRGLLDNPGEDSLDANGRMLFAEGYAALAAKVAAERAKLPKVAKSDFKARLVGVAVVASDNRSRWNKDADFLPPETHVEVPFGQTALFKVEYDFPEGYEARVWTRDEWPSGQQEKKRYFGSNPSGLYKGKGVATGFLTLGGRGKTCSLRSLAIRTSSEPEIDDETREWKIGSFPVDVVFKAKAAATGETSGHGETSTPQGWLDDLDEAKERARREKKQVLAAFEGSDWCGWCKKMEKDVYRQPDFMPTVSSRFVPVYVDKPRDRTLLREAVREKNPELHGKYSVRGVPCVVILDADGKEIGRVGGYKNSVAALARALGGVLGEKIPVVTRPQISMKAPVSQLRWLSVQEAARSRSVVHVCIDESHGGPLNENMAFYLPLLEKERGFAHKPCRYGLDQENLKNVNVLVLQPSWCNIPYLPTERSAVRSFLEGGGTAIVLVDGNEANLSMSRNILAEYGLSVRGVASASDSAPVTKGVPAIDDWKDLRNVECVDSSAAEPLTEGDSLQWSALLTAEDGGGVLLASRNVGKGHIVYASAGLRFSKEKMSDHEGTSLLWRRLLLSSACSKRLSPDSDIGERDVLKAPCSISVGPLVLCSAERWADETRRIGDFVKRALPVLEGLCVPRLTRAKVKYHNVILSGTGNWHWYWSKGRQHQIGLFWCGAPAHSGPLMQNILANMLEGVVWAPDEIPLRDYLAWQCLPKIGLEADYSRVMDCWGDSPTARYCRAFDAIRKECPEFPACFCRDWLRKPQDTSSLEFFSILSKSIGRDCRPYFAKEGVAAFGLGSGQDGQAGESALKFSDREIERMKGTSGDKAIQKVVDRLFPGWRVASCGGVSDEGWNRIGYLPEISGRRNICCTLPKGPRDPVKFMQSVQVPSTGAALLFSAHKTIYADAGFTVEVRIDGRIMKTCRVDGNDWLDEEFDLSPWSGKKIRVELRHGMAPGLKNARASWSRLEIK